MATIKIEKANCKFSTKRSIVIILSILILLLFLPRYSIAENVMGCLCIDWIGKDCDTDTLEHTNPITYYGLVWIGADWLNCAEHYCEVYGSANGREEDCILNPCADDDFCQYGYRDMARLRLCPDDSDPFYNGHSCFLRCDGNPGSKDFFGAIWDAWDRKCITCNGVLEDLVYGDSTNDIYCNNDCGDPDFDPIAGEGDCESACGAHPDCDEVNPDNYVMPGGQPGCNGGVINRADYCTGSCNFQDRFCVANFGINGCGADEACNNKYPGEICDTGGYVGFCTDTCQCDPGCPPCMADCVGPPDDDCETNICEDEDNCGGCGQVCDIANDNPLNHIVDPIDTETCKMGWCDCAADWSRYGACKPTTQYSWIPPTCADGSNWSACLTPWEPFEGFSLWARTTATGSSRAADLCGGGVEYVAKREFLWDTLLEKWVPEYTIYSCNYRVDPFNDNFDLDYGVGYMVYPTIAPPGAGANSHNVNLYPGLNFVGVTEGIVTQTALDNYILPDDARYRWICGR